MIEAVGVLLYFLVLGLVDGITYSSMRANKNDNKLEKQKVISSNNVRKNFLSTIIKPNKNRFNLKLDLFSNSYEYYGISGQYDRYERVDSGLRYILAYGVSDDLFISLGSTQIFSRKETKDVRREEVVRSRGFSDPSFAVSYNLSDSNNLSIVISPGLRKRRLPTATQIGNVVKDGHDYGLRYSYFRDGSMFSWALSAEFMRNFRYRLSSKNSFLLNYKFNWNVADCIAVGGGLGLGKIAEEIRVRDNFYETFDDIEFVSTKYFRLELLDVDFFPYDFIGFGMNLGLDIFSNDDVISRNQKYSISDRTNVFVTTDLKIQF